jgi:hypothetical protein
MGLKTSADKKKCAAMDSEPKKQQLDKKAMFDEWWKQTIDELHAEEDRLNPSAGDDEIDREEAERQEIDDGMELEEDDDKDDDKDDEIDREEAMYDMFIEDLKYLDLPELKVKERAEVEEISILDSVDTDEDEEEDTDEDEDEFRKICNTKNWCGRA